jgi:hypothetical protein
LSAATIFLQIVRRRGGVIAVMYAANVAVKAKTLGACMQALQQPRAWSQRSDRTDAAADGGGAFATTSITERSFGVVML